MNEKILTGLKRIGFTEYEAKAYLLLLNLGQSSAREIADTSDIPRSRIYSVLKTLIEKGFISPIEGTPTFYLPLDPDPIFTVIRDNKRRQSLPSIIQTRSISSKKEQKMYLIPKKQMYFFLVFLP